MNKIRSYIADGAAIIIGTGLVALAFDIFVLPNKFSPGGISGLADALTEIIPLTVGVIAFCLNIPLIIAAWRVLGFKALARTLCATGMLSVFLDLFALFVPTYSGNPLLAAGLGGAISGIGLGLLLLRGISTGGTDLLSILLVRAHPNMPVGTLLLFADAAVVTVAVIVFHDIEVALYSFIIIYVSARVVDAIIDGANYAKVIYIITDKGPEMVKELNQKTDRGCTRSVCYGGYTDKEKALVTTVTRQNTLAQTLALIKETDPVAFTFVVNAAEVHGEGFRRYRADINPEA